MIIIKDLVSKSVQLIAVAIAISILITLCLSNVVEAYKLVQVPANGLTNNYFDISIGEYRDKIVNNNLTLPDLLEFLNKQNTDILLLKETSMKVFGVYAVNHKFRPNIISGRTFSKEDFQNKTNTILISEELINKCINQNGKKYYLYDTNYFEVIGVYKKSNNPINQDAIAYFNLSTKNLKTINVIYDNYIYGNFQIDADRNTPRIVKEIDNYLGVKVTRSNIDNTFIDKLQKTLSAQGISIIPIILIMLLILLNSINIASNWIENRKKEITIRRLVGATNNKIAFMLFKDFMLLITLSYIPALLISVVISRIDLKIFYSFKFSIDTLLISYFTVVLTGLIAAGLMLFTYYKSSISRIRG